jgi:3-hydroxybutyryl-CoA dehydrogenase
MEINKVGVLGATGTMGKGIAQICAQAGYETLCSSRDMERANAAIASIGQQFARSVERQRMTKEAMDKAMSKLKGTANIADFKDCDLVIEAAAEDLKLKKDTFIQLDKIVKKGSILSTNTSVLSLTEIAEVTGRKDKVVGLHFFNPAPVMKLVEIIKTQYVSPDTLDSAWKFANSLEKTPVIVIDRAGFIVNRLAVPFMMHAMKMMEEGVASAQDIDTAVTLGLNHPMGPLALADLIGNDIVLSMANGIYAVIKEDRFVAPKILKDMVKEGKLGRKTGKGFYDYSKR